MSDVEALEGCVRMASITGASSHDIRPCISRIFFEGVTSQRGDYLYLLATECKIALDFDQDKTIDVLNQWNNQAIESLPQNKIFSAAKSAFRPSQNKPYGCTHQQIQPFCIGSTCWNHREGKASKLTLQEFVSRGWIGSKQLNPSGKLIYQALIQLFYKKGKPKNNIVYFTFRELERESSINRRSHRNQLEQLKRVGLLREIWINQKKGSVTRVLFSLPLPYPPKGNRDNIITSSIKVVS